MPHPTNLTQPENPTRACAKSSYKTVSLVTLTHMTTTELPGGFYTDAPMLDGRTAACEHWRRPGEVYRARNIWYITSYDGVRYAQKHPELFSSAHAFDAISGAVAMIPLAIDPPEHAHYRRILDPMLGPRRIDLREEELRAQLRAHIDAFAPQGRCDVVADLAYKFPTPAILMLFGLPTEDLPRVLHWVTGLIKNVSVNTWPTPRRKNRSNARWPCSLTCRSSWRSSGIPPDGTCSARSSH